MKLKKLHSLLAILLITAVVFSMMLLPGCRSSGVNAADVGGIKLSEMEDEALLQYVRDCGVTFPEKFRPDNPNDINVIRAMIRDFENDPYSDRLATVDIPFIDELYDEMRRVVRLYYGIET